MHAQLKKDDASLQKKSSDRHRESSSYVDRNPDLLSEETTAGFTSSPSHALPPPGQGQLPMQCKGLAENPEPTKISGPLIQRRENNTGLPDRLKNGIENLSGYSMDDVKVHYNSSKPAQLRAHAYTQGTAIHVAPRQEQHLPHEAWHVVQQKQGRVKPTLQLKGKAGVNDDSSLEREADVMGAKALRENVTDEMQHKSDASKTKAVKTTSDPSVIQKKLVDDFNELMTLDDLVELFIVEGNFHYFRLLQDALSAPPKWYISKYRRTTQKETNPLVAAVDPTNKMVFTIQNVKDFLQGRFVPGISNATTADIKGENDKIPPYQSAEHDNTRDSEQRHQEPKQWPAYKYNQLNDDEKSAENARIITETLKRMKRNRNRFNFKLRTLGIQRSLVPDDAGDDIKLLTQEFRKTTFFYGTAAERKTNKLQVANWFKKVQKKKDKRKHKAHHKAKVYSPGVRTTGYVKALNDPYQNAQMMDMYYGGQQYETWHMLANPVIAKYVHEMMGYAGEYKHGENMDTAFRKNFPVGGLGWQQKSKPNYGTGQGEIDRPENIALRNNRPAEWSGDMSATMEISRIIREGVKKFGGKIVFEGSEIYNQGHFVNGAYKGDTNVEAEALYPYFAEHPGSSTVKFGAGELVFHWKGKEVAPTRALFLSNWAHPEQIGTEVEYKGKKGVIYLAKDKKGKIEAFKVDIPDDWYWKFNKGYVPPPADLSHRDWVGKLF